MRAEIFRLDSVVDSCKYELDYIVKENIRLTDILAEVTSKDAERLDTLLAKQSEILDARLGLNQPVPAPQLTVKPIGKNCNWQVDFERKQRDAHWVKVIEDQEARDKAQAAGESK